jgi:predicted membrane protein
MKTVKIEVRYQESADRTEIAYRFVWGLVLLVVFNLLQIVIGVFAIAQFLFIAIRKKRNPRLHRLTRAFYDYACENGAYIFGLTDERSPLIPEL